ncbi:Dyp-type peroxidase [Nonomuraea turcica]|uniref:Dyp-type peroxidase n=1 Tax=Nonomuraea sp. G32 TaxID=3067274 RepID=UPI00273C573A|nr:Dyp-type peroxidase [Nonomuraea sp. G32]MDP4506246.1 Dyp-type peroxidase [Nonomuraea sp. G32]
MSPQNRTEGANGEWGRGPSRRSFLGVGAGLAAGAAGGAGLVAATDGESPRHDAAPLAPGNGQVVPASFKAAHQPGILTGPALASLVAAFHCRDRDRRALAGTLRRLSAEMDALMAGRRPQDVPAGQPPADSAILLGQGRQPVLVTLSVGASLFDERYGLADRRPAELVPMGVLANDRLDPARTHGDLLVLIQADHPDVCVHALRRLTRAAGGSLSPAWSQDGFARPDPVATAGATGNRNLLGFKDGTGNPDAADPALMDQVVWVGAGDGEPEWAVGGTYVAVRLIRLLVEQWDRTSLDAQERVMGRRKLSGAPLDGEKETDVPRYAEDPGGERTPLDSHIRLANPRTAGPDKGMLRKGFNYARGLDADALLDQGLVFVSYQRRLANFLQAQERLKGEPMEAFTRPEGGGFYYALPGAPGSGGYLGQRLVES